MEGSLVLVAGGPLCFEPNGPLFLPGPLVLVAGGPVVLSLVGLYTLTVTP